jgi:signal transduction histidine kinase
MMRSELLRRAIPVAALAAVLAAAIFVLAAVAVDLVVSGRLTSGVDQRIGERLEGLRQQGSLVVPPVPIADEEDRSFEAPLVGWQLDATGQVVRATAGSPTYPSGLHVGGAMTVTIAGTPFRLNATQIASGSIVVGESLAGVDTTMRSLTLAELAVGPGIVVLVFLGTLLAAFRVAGPIEQARQRQLTFTADASHELRTPLSVIEAETSLALRRPRDESTYRDTLTRVLDETGRLRRIVEDLLVLARADTLPPAPSEETSDLGELARRAVERFQAIAQDRKLALSAQVADEPMPVGVPAEWVDRVLGILLDNACRYTPPGGRIEVGVEPQSRRRVRLTVDDSGPGIPESERRRIFDRFHRVTTAPGGAGLGLSIADAIVRASQGRWEIDRSPMGGAHLAISWPRALIESSGSPVTI